MYTLTLVISFKKVDDNGRQSLLSAKTVRFLAAVCENRCLIQKGEISIHQRRIYLSRRRKNPAAVGITLQTLPRSPRLSHILQRARAVRRLDACVRNASTVNQSSQRRIGASGRRFDAFSGIDHVRRCPICSVARLLNSDLFAF